MVQLVQIIKFQNFSWKVLEIDNANVAEKTDMKTFFLIRFWTMKRAGFRNAIIDYWSLCQVEFWEGEKKRWRLPRRKLCLFVDSACLLASASHMNIFPNVTRPQLRAKNQHHSDEATSSSLPVRWPAVQRRRRCGGGGIAQAAAVSTAFYTHAYALLWLVGSSCHVSCLFAHCRRRRRGHTAPSRLGSLRRRRVLSSCLMCALQALSSLLPCEHLLLLKCVRFWPFVRVKTSYNLTPPEQLCWRLSKLGGDMPIFPPWFESC